MVTNTKISKVHMNRGGRPAPYPNRTGTLSIGAAYLPFRSVPGMFLKGSWNVPLPAGVCSLKVHDLFHFVRCRNMVLPTVPPERTGRTFRQHRLVPYWSECMFTSCSWSVPVAWSGGVHVLFTKRSTGDSHETWTYRDSIRNIWWTKHIHMHTYAQNMNRLWQMYR